MAKDEHPTLDIPQGSTIEDPGAHDLESSDSDEHFSDAQSGRSHASGNVSPVPITRVEKVDNEPSYGEIPGTDAYHMRESDAEPDEIAVMGESYNSDTKGPGTPTPGGQPIPLTVVERVDDTPAHGEVPGTHAHEQRAADAVPDLVVRSGSRTPSNRSRAGSTPGDLPIPTTKIEKVDSEPRHGEVPGTDAYAMRTEDATPDEIVNVGDISGSPTLPAPRSSILSHARRKSSGAISGDASMMLGEYNEEVDGSDGGFGDDFDDFEEGEQDGEFGDFDDGFQEADAVTSPPSQSIPLSVPITAAFPVFDFSNFDTPEEVQDATEPYMKALFPPETISTSTISTPQNEQHPIFFTPRSASLWSQLIAPPPLQPPNWIRSRIRRLFLVSLGVPVDLDEILPASKQKKLVLYLNPPTNTNSPRNSSDTRSISRLKAEGNNASSTSLDSQGKPTRSDSTSRRRKGAAPAPALDLVAARQLCTVTNEALNGFTVEELEEHIKKLEGMVGTAKEVLDYWTKKTDEMLGDREAFEGVIENLVKHARKTRK